VKKMRVKLLWVYLISIWIAEITLVKISLTLGVFLHIIIVLSIFILTAVYYEEDIAKLYLSLSLVPFLRILNLSTPIVPIPPIYWYIPVGIPGWIAAILFIKIFGLSPQEIGFKAGRIPSQVMVGIISGIPLGILSYLSLRPEPLISAMEIFTLITAIVIISLFVVLPEEIVFRGILFKSAIRVLDLKWAYIFAVLTYCSAYISHLSIGYIIVILIAGCTFCRFIKHFNSLLAASVGHIITSITAYLIWPFYYDAFYNTIKKYDYGVIEKMISIINPLVKNVNDRMISEWPKVAILAIIFLIILLVLREISATIAEYSTPPQLCWSQTFIKQINIGLIPLLYVFTLNVFTKILETLFF